MNRDIWRLNPDLSEFCAPDASGSERMVNVDPNVALRVVRFDPAVQTGRPQVVLVGGWITIMPAWGDVLREMTKDFTVYYVETREKQSSLIKGRVEYSAEAFGRDIVALTDKLDIKEDDYILMGSSLGATSVLDGCRFIRKKPLCLALIGPNAEFRVPRFGKVIVACFFPPMWFVLKPIVKWYLKTFRLDFKHDPRQYYKYARNIDSADPWKLKKAIMKLWKYQVWDLLGSIDIPTLIIGASKDKLHIPENLKRMVELMPDARYLDMGTNEATHRAGMVEAVRQYIEAL